MLGLFGKKSDHPLADMKSAQEVLKEIPPYDAVAAVQELTGWIEAVLEHADEAKLDHQLAVLRLFDEAAQPHVRKLLREYFVITPLTKFQESRHWMVLNNYYLMSERAHHDILVRYRNGGRGAAAIKGDLPLLGARGIAALTGHVRMALARFALVENAVWKHLAEFYWHAEAGGYQNHAVGLYPGMPVATSVAQEFAALLTWYGACGGTQNPLQSFICERVVAHIARELSIGTKGGGLYAFDASQPDAPIRTAADHTAHSGTRFVEQGGVLKVLEGLLKTFEKGVVPEDIFLFGAKFEAELMRDSTKRLMEILSMPMPTRRNPRRKINVSLRIAQGFHKILEQTEVGLNFSQTETETRWEVEDISVNGFRCVVPAAQAEDIIIGSLVGSRPDNVPHWGAGIVRRLSRDAANNLHIGVEMLSPQAVGVTLFERGESMGEDVHIALYLNRPADTSGEAWLLMRPERLAENRSLLLEQGGKRYLLLPLGKVEGGADYDLVRFRRMEQDTSSGED